MGKIERGLRLMTASFRVISRHKKLMLFSFFSGLFSMIAAFSFLVPIFFGGAQEPENFTGALGNAKQFLDLMDQRPLFYFGYSFAAYFVLYFIAAFFNVATISCVMDVYAGKQPRLRDGFSQAVDRVPYILGWVALAATVGAILSIIQHRSNKVGQIIAGVIGVIWSVATYFVVPILAVERVGPLAAIDKSIKVLKKTWGENLVADVGFGLIFGILRFLWILILGVGVLLGGKAAVLFFILGLLYLFFLELARVSMEPIFLGAVYLYARDGIVVDGMETELLLNSFQKRED